MKIGLQVVRFNWPGHPENTGATLKDIARTAEDVGFSSLWLMDHYYQIAPCLGDKDDPMLQPYTALCYMTAVTKEIKLGTMVTGVIYREPAYLVKTVSNLDVLSSGRAYLGIGAAWYEEEATGMGFPFPPLKERFERLEETLQITHQMWRGDRSPHHGKHYRLKEPINQPQPLSEPHPPILIGGMGEQKTLRMVAQYGDACNLYLRAGTEELAHKLEVLHGHCEDLGRDYGEIEKTTLGTVHLAPGEDSPADLVDICRELADLGFDQAIFNMPDIHEITPLERIGEDVIPVLSEF